MERHLIIEELAVLPAHEWKPEARVWTIIRVADGAGYFFQAGTTKELNPGDTVIAGPAAQAVLRASLLGPLKLQFFCVLPQYLDGLLTVAEWAQLETISQQSSPRCLFFLASDPLSQKFSRLATLKHRDSLASRSCLLQLWASSIDVLLPAPAESTGLQLRDRFRALVSRMSEAELAARSLPELAAELQCSERHFSRLFREEFKVSLRTHQTELRMHRASQLLADSEVKVALVARESGYRHIGLFNLMFKKQFGMTPSAWREKMMVAALVLLLETFGKLCEAAEQIQLSGLPENYF